MLPKIIKEDIEIKFPELKINNSKTLGGGDINSAALLETNKENYFIKWNNADKFPLMFEKEAKGLKLIENCKEIETPKIIDYSEVGNYSYLLLEYLEPIAKSVDFYTDFGRSLAKLHKHTNKEFGLEHNNYIGSLAQINSYYPDWVDFFIINRLEYQIKIARDNSLLNSSDINKFNKIFSKLDLLIPNEKPSLIHGDLWGGNYLCTKKGATLIDPAVYYGHREMDLGMSKLFGGFSEEFYKAYNEEFPLEKDWEERIDLCNLYPLLVHLNLFGSSYYFQINGILNVFI